MSIVLPVAFNASQAHALRYAGRDRELDASILRLGSSFARDIVAYQVSNQRLDFPCLREAVLAGKAAEALNPVEPEWSVDGVLRLAKLLAYQDLHPTDRPVALTLLNTVASNYGRKALGTAYRKLLVETALQLRAWDIAKSAIGWLPTTLPNRAFLQADLINPHVHKSADTEDWLALVNTALPGDRMDIALDSSLSRRSGDRSAFGALSAATIHPFVDGPLVTVGVACWCPDATLLTSVYSLLAQTWRNIEILVVDDGSPVEYQPLLDRVAALDPRIRVLRQSSNGGTYRIRNRVLDEAGGEFFTVQDADDWAHPLRIQRQVESMLENPGWVACHCWGFRCNDELLFNYIGVAPCRVNESSLLFRRKAVVESVGYYHDSRKGADSEYTGRLRRHFGEAAVGRVDICLTGIRLSTGSLSRSEFKPGWRHPNRSIYRRNYERWQLQMVFAEVHLGTNGFACPTFKAPAGFLPERATTITELDLLFVGDFRGVNSDVLTRIIPGIRAAQEISLRTAFCHVDSLRSVGTHAFEEYDVRVLELMAMGLAEVSVSERLQARKVVFLSGSELQYLDSPHPLNLHADQAILLVTGDDLAGDSYGPYFDFGLCLDRIHSISGAIPSCHACDLSARQALKRLLPKAWVSVAAPWPAMPKADSVRPRPIAGRDLAWGIRVASEGLMYSHSWVLQERKNTVRLFLPTFTGRSEYLPKSIRIYNENPVDQAWFLDTIDVLVELEEWGGQGALPALLQQALERGIRIVLPVSWKGFTGGKYTYYDPMHDPGI